MRFAPFTPKCVCRMNDMGSTASSSVHRELPAPAPARIDARPLILHVVYRFDTGGLENGVVNLINHMDEGAYRHAVMALTEVTDFAKRIRRSDVEFISLNKSPGHGLPHYARWRREILRLQPAIVHTRNLGALEMQVPAALAGVRARIHGEHGRDMSDPHGTVRKYQWVRRVYSPFVHRYISLSQDLANYLTGPVGIGAHRVSQVYNGVDISRFCPVVAARSGSTAQPDPIPGCPFNPAQHLIIGTVGRLQAEKDQLTLVRAFAQALRQWPNLRPTLRLAVVGDGPLRAAVEAETAGLGVQNEVWLAGTRSEVPTVLRGLHAFVLPSRAEGISNTILEAMATGLPVLATAVGGNPELVVQGQTGLLVPAGDPTAMANALLDLRDAQRRTALGHAGRRRVEAHFSLQAMVGRYQAIYDEFLT